MVQKLEELIKTHPTMYRNYLKIALRNLRKNKISSLINIGGLAVGMAVAMIIGLWIWDEVTYDRYHANYERIAQVMQHQTFNGEVGTQVANPALMGGEIRDKYGSDFKYVLQSSWNGDHTLAYQDKKLLKPGNYFEPEVTEMLSLNMLQGTRDGLKEPYSILLSASVAKAFFGDADPMGKIFKVDNQADVKVTGVYEDLPLNSTFRDMTFILPWKLYLISNPWVEEMEGPWGSNFTQTFAQIADHAEMAAVSAKIKNVKLNKVDKEEARYKPVVFLHPMSQWHLYEEFKDGKNIGGRIQTVWLFGIIGLFVLLLACINFMNLSTARSEKRAKEVGIRKSIGSLRTQLITQFFSESLLVAMFAFVFSIVLVLLMLPFFNAVADKKMSILWSNPFFWTIGIVFSLLTGLIAGTYPAFYLSSFQPLKVLKGTFRVGPWAAVPRKVLVVVQFTVSITLIIGTVIVFRQIEFAKNRPIGYERDGLVYTRITEPIHTHFDAISHELKSSGAIVAMTGSGSPTTEVWNTNGGFNWEGKDPSLGVDFPNNAVTHDYGKTVGWKIKAGRDFSREFASDTSAFILNEAAVKFIGFKEPIGSILEWNDEPYRVIGVVEDLLVQSPYQPVRPSLFHIETGQANLAILKINPERSPKDALGKIAAVFAKNDPASVFNFQFVDEEYAQKFGDEVRTGKLATFFAILAVFISCLGLFGLASFVAEQRTKEIGVRKVLGATILNVWGLLSREFIALVLISCLLAIPLSYYYLHAWLQKYEYRTEISWWIFAVSVLGALAITVLTVSYQSIRAGMINPVKSLRSE